MLNFIKFISIALFAFYFEINLYSQTIDKVYFKIQIAASKSPLPNSKLNSINKSNQVLIIEYAYGWYKYTIKEKFLTYEKASDYKNSMGIKGAFIIAYKNEQRVDIKEVINHKAINAENVNKIVYRLELAVSIKKANAKTMEMINSGGMPIITYKHKSWYSYTIGDFNTEKDAAKFKNKKQLVDAKIVKYKNGKPLK